MTVLVAEDSATNRKLLRAQLEAEGHTVLEAVDGAEALAALERQHVDAVVSDNLMPKMDGFRLCREIRRHARLSALPFILYTSSDNSASDRRLADAVGADGYVVKPAPPPVLLEALREAIRRSHDRRP